MVHYNQGATFLVLQTLFSSMVLNPSVLKAFLDPGCIVIFSCLPLNLLDGSGQVSRGSQDAAAGLGAEGLNILSYHLVTFRHDLWMSLSALQSLGVVL